MSREHFLKHVLTPVIGFGLGGALWGWQAYVGTVGSDKVFVSPFSYILGAVFLGIFGSGSLVLFSKNRRLILRMIGTGIILWIIAFVAVSPWIDWWLVGGSLLTLPLLLIIKIIRFDVVQLLVLNPSLVVGQLWPQFLVAGLISGLIYALLLKTTLLRAILFGGGGFVLASIISPIIGNLMGDLFSSLSMGYSITFLLIGVIFGLSLVWGLKKNVEAT